LAGSGRLRGLGFCGRRAGRDGRALVGVECTLPGLAGGIETDALAVVCEGNLRKRELACLELLPGGFRQGQGQPFMVEGGAPGALLGVHDNELSGTVPQVVAVPELRIVFKPMRGDGRLIDAPLRGSAAPLGRLVERIGVRLRRGRDRQ
jgi:hypothetical protein